ncbi:MAG: hypothetical protein JNN17_10565 [Verrucomicrobiaceae bacterium]|nr:hypothetical protein [Verrucomicrobiaceae bacterium]
MHTLTTFFDWLLTASLRASVLTLGVWLVQGLLQRHLSPRWRYALWLPVLVVLLMPVLPESRWSAASVFTMDAPAATASLVSVVVDDTPSAMPVPTVYAAEPVRTVDWPRVRVIAWAVGASLVLLMGLISFTRTLTRARRTREAISEDLATRIDEVTQEVGLRQKPRLLMSARIQSPAVTGLLRPLLLLPPGFDRDFTAEEKRLILHHELMHLKRGDLPLNTLLCVLMALHWFNPLLWLAFLKVRADREAACDAQVLENATPQRRSAYGHALLKIESAFAPLRLSLGFIGILQRHASLRARIRSIAAPARTRPFTGLVVTACMLVMTFLGVTRAEKPAEHEPKPMLMQIQMRIINFKEASDWNFGGKLPPFDSDAKPGLDMDVLSQPDVEKLMRETIRMPGADITSYPRMAVEEGKAATIRSVVNQPIASDRKDKDGKPAIDYLPIGFIGSFTVKRLPNEKLHLDLDIKDSQIIGETQVAGNPYPIVRSAVYQAPIELSAGMSAVYYGWKLQQETQKPRPVLYVITPGMVASESTKPEKKPSPAKITADQTTFDEKTGIGRSTGHAKLEVTFEDGPHITADAEEIEMHQQEDLVIVKAPLELTLLGMRIRCDDAKGEAVIHLKTGKFQTRGATFRTELLEKPPFKNAASEAAAQAAKLRAARPQQYDFSKSNLGDVLRYLASDADLKFISLPDDHPASKKLVTFSIKDSPFAVLETIAKANGLMLVLDKGVWHIRPSDEADLISRTYPLLNSTVKPAEILNFIQKLAKAPASVKFDEKSGTFLVNATRLQQSWVEGYFKGLHGKP